MNIVASAPGKLFFTGEYAVLERAPALLSAVDVRAICRLERVAGNVCRMTTPPLSATPFVFRLKSGEIEWDGEPVPLFEAAWQSLDAERRERLAAASWHVSLDTSAFFIKSRKIGLGSSAAALAALSGALWAASGGLPDARDAFGMLQRGHARWQGGGSGADLAVALAGGTLLFRREPWTAAPVTLPAGLEVLPVWTGVPASTADFLRRLEAFRDASPNGYAQCLAVLSQQAEEAAVAVTAGRDEFIAAFRAYGAALRALGEVAGLDIWSEAHVELAGDVEAAGGAYKPSGAGGGDVGLAVTRTRDAAVTEQVKSALSSSGRSLLPIRFGARGLNVRNMANE